MKRAISRNSKYTASEFADSSKPKVMTYQRQKLSVFFAIQTKMLDLSKPKYLGFWPYEAKIFDPYKEKFGVFSHMKPKIFTHQSLKH
jgi:hypothetical protein